MQRKLYRHYRWTLPSIADGGPLPEALTFCIITVDMAASETLAYIDTLPPCFTPQIKTGVKSLVSNFLRQRPPNQIHSLAFISASTTSMELIKAPALVICELLQKKSPNKPITMIPMPWMLFQQIQELATAGEGFVPGPPPSLN